MGLPVSGDSQHNKQPSRAPPARGRSGCTQMLRVLIAVLLVALLAAPSEAPPAVPGAGGPAAVTLLPTQPEPPDVGLSVVPDPTTRPTSEKFFVRIIEPAADSELLEGSEVSIRWDSGGPIDRVRLYYYYDRCRLGGRSRGRYGRVIFGQMIPNLGRVPWTVPWMDTDAFRLRMAGYDREGSLIAADEVGVRFRPAELKDLPAHAIGIIKKRQRLYYYENGRIRRMHIISTAAPGYTTPTMHPGSHDRRRGAMGQVFRKSPNAWSRRYTCWMPYWLQITSTGSHGIHATSPPFYRYLGRGASHGCVRQHRSDARALYQLVDVGTPVYIF